MVSQQWTAPLGELLLQATQPCLVGVIADREQLGTSVTPAHRIEPNPQILREMQTLALDAHRNKTARLHDRANGFQRPEILQVESPRLGKYS